MFKSSGAIIYYPNFWAVIYVDQNISNYYNHWVYLHYFKKINKQKYPAHITVVYGEKYNDIPTLEQNKPWGYNAGEEIEFEYTNEIFYDEPFWKIPVICPKIDEIRKNVGLKVLFCDKHITIGNEKSI